MKLPPWAILLAGLGCAGCGGSTSEPTVADEPSPQAPTRAEPAPVQSEPVDDDEAETTEDPEEAGSEQESGPKQREVLFKQTQGGLIVDIDGVRFKPTAEPVKKPNGGYGIKITVEAESIDDDTHVLLSPENGPLSFFVKILDKNGAEAARYGDERVGDEQQFIMPGGPLTLTREWPSGSVKGPLWWGQSVKLEVGLWGIGLATEKTRPMKKFFVVNMVGGAKPQAIVTHPEIN